MAIGGGKQAIMWANLSQSSQAVHLLYESPLDSMRGSLVLHRVIRTIARHNDIEALFFFFSLRV